MFFLLMATVFSGMPEALSSVFRCSTVTSSFGQLENMQQIKNFGISFVLTKMRFLEVPEILAQNTEKLQKLK